MCFYEKILLTIGMVFGHMNIDFGKTTSDYSAYRKGFPDSFFERVEKLGILNSAAELLDIGTGTGTLARGFAKKGLNVTGIDKSEELINEATKIAFHDKLKINFQVGFAESLNFQNNSFDIVTAGQCWHWFDRDKTGREIFRVLKANGYLIIAHFDWLPLPGNVVEMTERLILKYNPLWAWSGGNGIYPEWFKDVSIAGFKDIESFTYDTIEIYSQEAWRGRIRASAGISASLDETEVKKFDLELENILNVNYGDTDLKIPHRIFTLICKSEK